MQYFIILSLVSFLMAFNSPEAVVEEHEFVGTIQLIDKSIISYKVNFVENNDGTIEGYSITDFSGDHKTKTKIRGKIDRKKNLISFSETENILTKSSSESEEFCYIHIYNAKLKLKKKKSYIQGHFFSRYADGSLCIEGDIFLIGEQQFFKKMNRAISIADKVKKTDELAQVKENLARTKESLENTVLADGSKITISEAKGERIIINVFDTEYLDGDKISIFQNGICILDNYKVIGKKFELPIVVTQDTTHFRIVADNEGRYPPNSAQIEIKSKDNDIPIRLNLLQGNEAEIQLIAK